MRISQAKIYIMQKKKDFKFLVTQWIVFYKLNPSEDLFYKYKYFV